jgi:glycosyltransferase involved in cell wall biosynthesis
MSEREDYPLISAITIAGKEQVPDLIQCIACFKAQTYPYKELIIVNNAINQLEASGLNIKAEKDVFLFDTPNEMTIGMARAQGMSAANGQLIAQFDIDYWHAPTRLEQQVSALAQQNAHVSVLSSCLSYSYVSGRAGYLSNERQAILGTMVHIRQNKVNYPTDYEKYEELAFLGSLKEQGYKPISILIPELCCKFNFTNEARILEPTNNGLSDNHFKLIQTILKDRHGSIYDP